MVQRFEVKDLDELEKVACQISEIIKDKGIVCLYGDLGSGKTTLVKYILKCRNFDPDDVSSPSFTIMNIYKNNNEEVVHYDFYRIKDSREFYFMDYDEFAENKLTFIEWPERVEEYIDKIDVKINIFISGDKRIIEVEYD